MLLVNNSFLIIIPRRRKEDMNKFLKKVVDFYFALLNPEGLLY